MPFFGSIFFVLFNHVILVCVILAVMRHTSWPKQAEEERVYLHFHITVHQGKSGQELKHGRYPEAGADAEAVEAKSELLTDLLPTVCSACFPIEHQLRGSLTHNEKKGLKRWGSVILGMYCSWRGPEFIASSRLRQFTIIFNFNSRGPNTSGFQ